MSPAKPGGQRGKREANRGAWTSEEDQKLAHVIEIHGPRKWKSLAAKAGKIFFIRFNLNIVKIFISYGVI